MNVLQVNTVYPGGSTGRIVAEIAEYTASQPNGHAYVAFGIGEPAMRESLTAIRIGNPWERKAHAAIRKLFDAEGYGSWFATGRLIRFCKGNAIDVVHLHNLHGCYLHLKRWFRYLRKSNHPVVWTLHDCWPLTGHCAHFEYASCGKWQLRCGRCPEQRSYPRCIGLDGSKRNHRLKRKLFSSLKNLTLVTPCNWLRDIVLQSYLQDVPVRVIYNGVDSDAFRPTASDLRMQYGFEGKRVLFAAASVWTDRKGLLELTKLSQMLNASYRIVIAGLTGEQIAALPGNVIGLNKIESQPLLRAWYTAADCFVNPTLEDTMPLVNLEALACGTPVAAFRTGGCPEAIAEGCGLVVEKDDVRGLAEAVRRICESGVDFTEACLAQARRFSMENTVRAYTELYREVSR
jgi:putative colanic acid biosynthesis glycosyltransferase